jgi:hypothetical protein
MAAETAETAHNVEGQLAPMIFTLAVVEVLEDILVMEVEVNNKMQRSLQMGLAVAVAVALQMVVVALQGAAV